MAICYSALQKSFRSGDLNKTSFWSHQIGDLYPNALRKRLCQNSLEDACGLNFALSCLKNTKAPKKPSFEELNPYVTALTGMKKTHSAAWLNRVAADHLFRGLSGDPKGDEVEQAAYALKLHSEGSESELLSLYGEELMGLYKYTNKDPLTFMCKILISGRPELAAIQGFALGPLPPPSPQQVLDHYNDKHTKLGKKLGRGYQHFLENLILHNPVYVGSAEPYKQQAEHLYLNFKDSKGKGELRVKHVLDLIKENKTSASKTVPAAVPEVIFKDTDVLKIDSDTVGLGFKNATFICPVNMNIVSPLKSGDKEYIKKFVKIGESPTDLNFALQCSHFRSSLNLPSPDTSIATLKLSGDINYSEIASLGKGGDKWRTSISRKILQILKNNHSNASTLFVDVFTSGVRLSDITASSSWIYWNENFGIELLKVLLFRKFVGSKDTNAFNLMAREVNGEVQILSVDENEAGKERLRESMGKGLETAQRIKYDFKVKCAEAVAERTEEVGEFLEKMKRLWEERFEDLLGKGGRMKETHRKLFREWDGGKDVVGVCRKWLGVSDVEVVKKEKKKTKKKKRKFEVDEGESKKRTKT
ncbi:hypothetical protein TrST_g10912 [Triparma strigata]|uniref:Uncharacterized protein n=1 Tax=Triparma strigata TaxID=1606541 RepID=A0A9W7BCI9_9STRA|nr:hypothetical protein TrST_g10912 [Triparma strigata]